MSDTSPFNFRPVTRRSAPSWKSKLVDSLSHDDEAFEKALRRNNFTYLLAVREKYQSEGWKWNRGAEFLFTCLIHALDLEDDESFIQQAASPQRGRPENAELAAFIQQEKAAGKNIRQIQTRLKKAGKDMSPEKIREYLKPRRWKRQRRGN